MNNESKNKKNLNNLKKDNIPKHNTSPSTNQKNQFSYSKNGYNNSSIRNYKKTIAKESLKKGANAYVPVIGGKVVEELSKTKTGDKILNQAADNSKILPSNPFNLFKSKRKTNEQQEEQDNQKDSVKGTIELINKITKFMAIVPGLLSGCFVFLVIVTIICVIISPLFYMDSLLGKTSSFFEKIGNFVTLRGWCSDEECAEIEKNDFYEEVEKIYDKYYQEKGVQLNTSLIIATLTYVDPLITINEDEPIDENNFTIEDFNSSNIINFKKSKKMVRLLAENMVTSCCFENDEEYECAEYPNSNLSCPADVIDEETGEVVKKYTKKNVVNVDFYREYLEDVFIRKFYFENKTGPEIDKKIEDVVEQIFSRTEFYENIANSNSNKITYHTYAYCSGVTMVDTSGNVIGTYNLDDYVAGVVRHEMSSNQNSEAYKALAIAARTYTLAVTNNCSVSIENSTSSQMATIEDVDDYASAAAKETSGKILIYNDNIFASQYDSFCYNDSDCQFGEEDGKLYVIYTKLPNNEKHKVYLSKDYEQYINGGNGYGLSQVVAYEMANNGSTYEEILKFFYSDGVKITSMVTSSGEYNSSSTPPTSASELKEKSDYYASLGIVMIGQNPFDLSILYNSNASNLGQCVWYARSRALELILTSDMDEETKYQALVAISNTRGNGESWFDNPSLSIFEKNSDYSMPLPGSIVSWSGGSSVCSPRCGHVAIVESVDYDNKTITISEGWNSGGPGGPRNWDNVVFNVQTYTFEEIKGYTNPRSYSFNGYVYILG